MATSTAVTVTEYLNTDYSPDCEYVDGEVLERNVGEWNHSRLQMLLSDYLFRREKTWGIVVVVEQRVQVKATRYRVPDILVLTSPPKGQIIDEPPFLCIEILSPDDRVTATQEKIDDYLEFGVSYVWVIDPKTRRAFVHTADGVSQAKDGVLRAGGIVVPFGEL